MSSKRAVRRRSCTGKARYVDFAAADWAMHRLLRHEGPKDDRRMNVYRCRFCRGFHFGHAPRPRASSRGALVLVVTVR